MVKSRRIEDFFSDYYRRADEAGWIPSPAEEVDRVCRILNLRPKPGQKALDFNCGEGRNTRYLCDIGYEVVATDVIDEAVTLARKRLAGRKAAIEKVELGKPLPFREKEFTLVLAFHTLQWLAAKEQFLSHMKELVRMLTDDGHLIFTMPTERNYHTAKGIKIGGDRYEVTTEQRGGAVQYSPSLPTLRELIDGLALDVKLFGRHEFGYDGAESTVESPLSMFMFCVCKRR